MPAPTQALPRGLSSSYEDTLEGRLLDLLLELNAPRANWPSEARATCEVREVLRNSDWSSVNRALDLLEAD